MKGFSGAIEWRPIESLCPSPRNPRRHGAEQIAKLVASLRRFGWARPLLIADDGEIVAGEAVWRAARAAGETMAPVLALDRLDAAARRCGRCGKPAGRRCRVFSCGICCFSTARRGTE